MNKFKIEKKRFDVDFELKAISEEETEQGKYFMFEGYLSTFDNVDHGGDVVLKGAFTESIAKKMPSLLWQHDHGEPIGVYVEAYEDNIGLFVKGKLPMDDDFVRGRVVPQMKIGSIKTMSIGYLVERQEDINYREDGTRELKKLLLLEGSLVTIPMNDMAKVSGFKGLLDKVQGLDPELQKELVQSLNDGSKYTFEDVKHITSKKELERFLRDAGTSRKAATYIAAQFKTDSDQSNFDDDVNKNNNSAVLNAIAKLTKSIEVQNV